MTSGWLIMNLVFIAWQGHSIASGWLIFEPYVFARALLLKLYACVESCYDMACCYIHWHAPIFSYGNGRGLVVIFDMACLLSVVCVKLAMALRFEIIWLGVCLVGSERSSMNPAFHCMPVFLILNGLCVLHRDGLCLSIWHALLSVVA